MLYKKIEIKVDGYEETADLYTYILDNSVEMHPQKMRPVIVICPGGGYAMTSDREAEPIAMQYLAKGYHAVILRYSVAPARYPLALMQLAKTLGISVFIVGHVTKDGAVAGPRTLEHMVDTVLYFEGDRYESYRILRGVKNRFGSTNEIGVFEMKAEGLVEVENPSEYMLSGKPEGASGSIVTCSIEGSRPILLEIQALVCHSFFNNPRRTANGTDYNKVNLLMAVLEKRANLSLSDCDAYVNIAGGIRMNEPAIDLGIVLAIASSKKDIIVREDIICFGEVGLSGEVRGVTMSEQRVAEAKKLGFKKCIVPKVCLAGVSHISGIEIVGVANIKEAIEAVR